MEKDLGKGEVQALQWTKQICWVWAYPVQLYPLSNAELEDNHITDTDGFLIEVELTFEEQGFGLLGSTYTWIFSPQICPTVRTDLRLFEATDADRGCGGTKCRADCKFRLLTLWRSSTPTPALFKGQLYKAVFEKSRKACWLRTDEERVPSFKSLS